MEKKITTREEEKSETFAESQPQKVPPKSLSAKNCLVCFCLFNENEKRPRTIPCGHTFCSECITSAIKDLIFTCPNCRKTYEVPSASVFPISNIALELIREMVTDNTEDSDEVSEDAMESSEPTSKRLKLQITDALTEVESVSCKSSNLRSQLQLYSSQLDEWKSEHQQFTSQIDDMIQKINREKTRIDVSLGEEALAKAELARTADSLKAQTRTLKIFKALEKVHNKCDNQEEWMKTVNESFPNIELVTKSQELRKRCNIEPVNPSPYKVEEQEHECDGESLSIHQDVIPVPSAGGLHGEGTSSDEKCLVSCTTIQEKIRSLTSISHNCSAKAIQTQYNSETNAMQAVSECESKEVQTQPKYETKGIQTDSEELFDLYLKAEDTLSKQQYLRKLIQPRPVFALQEKISQRRYARLSLDEKRVWLHALSDEPIKPETYPTIIKYEEILRDVPSTSRRTFLEFSFDWGRSTGRVVISLIDEGNLTENFYSLCMGREQGLSYRHSNIWRAEYRDSESEHIRLGNYERNDFCSSGGKAVVPGVDWSKECQRDIYKRTHLEAGFVWGWTKLFDDSMSQFIINTKDAKGAFDLPCIGKVVEGLDVIKDIIDKYDNRGIKNVTIIDCGVVLSTFSPW